VISGHSGDVGSSSLLSGSSNVYQESEISHRRRRDYKTTVKYYGAVRCKGEDDNLKMKDIGLDTSSFLPTVWNLIPYSFLVDYFTNIGTVIDAFSQRNVGLAWGARTQRRQTITSAVDVVCTIIPNPQHVLLRHSFSPGKFMVTETDVVRSPIDSVPIPSIAFRMPGFSTKWINMAALGRTHSSMLPF
jgi:hypothetical protein